MNPRLFRLQLALAVLLPASAALAADEVGTAPDLSKAKWIWSGAKGKSADAVVFFRRRFILPSRPIEATVAVTADNGYDLFVNNHRIGGELGYGASVWSSVERFRVEKDLAEGTNVIAIRGEDLGGAAGVVAAVHIRTEEGEDISFVTDGSWLAAVKSDPRWAEPAFDDSRWTPAVVVACMGDRPWGMLTVPKDLTDSKKLVTDRSVPGEYTPPAEEKFAEPGKDFHWPEGVVFLRGNVAKPHHFPLSRREPGNRAASLRLHAYPESDVPAPAVVGKQMYVLCPARPDGHPRLLLDAGGGSLGSPSVSYDGKTLYFSMAPEGKGFYHIYRLPLAGGDPEALTQGPFHDYDPEPLPDGRILFSSTRIGSREEYHGNLASSLFVMSADGAGIRPFTYHIVADREPKVTAFGSLVMVRSDNFLERAKVETQIHHMRLDGTGGMVLLGNDRAAIPYLRPQADETGPNPGWLRANGFGSPAPLPDGRVAALSKDGLVITGPGRSGMRIVQTGVGLFDVSSMPDGRLLCTALDRRSLGIADPDTGNVWRLYRADKPDVHSVVYLGPRRVPPAMPAATNGEDDSGYLYCQSVFNTKQKNADLSRIKAVRVYEGRPLALRPDHFPYEHIGVEAVELGTVPLAPDGSFYVRVPADRALALQAVDAEGRSVISELSWIYCRPGERRSCVGCHSPRNDAPVPSLLARASHARPMDLLGQGQPYRFRGNNAEVGGVLNLQLDRMREAAAIDAHHRPPPGEAEAPLPPGRSAEVRSLCGQLAGRDAALKISSAQRLAVFRDRAAAPALLQALKDPDANVRMNVAMTLSACGNREGVPALLDALADEEPLVAQAANMALENLTGREAGFDAFDPAAKEKGAAAWRQWVKENPWETVEAQVIGRLADPDLQVVIKAAQTLGHTGGDAACAALRDFVARSVETQREARSDLRAIMAAMRALGHLRDAKAVDLLADVLNRHITPKGPQNNVYLAATAAEALGWIATPAAEKALLEACPKLQDFWLYTGICGDHPVLVANHSCVLHYRMLEALDALGTRSADVVPIFIRSVPMDVDRGLLVENDSYESLVTRLAQRSGLTPALMETCLAVLGDPEARPEEKYRADVTASPLPKSWGEHAKKTFQELLKQPRGGLACLPYDPEIRAAQIASVLCMDPRLAPRLAAAFGRYRALNVSPDGDYGRARTRAWACFYLARGLGKLRAPVAVEPLIAALEQDPPEATLGVVTPPAAMIYKPITPFYRAAAAYALGEIGDRKAVPVLLKTVSNLDNALDVRHSAARGLALLCDQTDAAPLEKLAKDYPEVATRRLLLEARRQAESRR